MKQAFLPHDKKNLRISSSLLPNSLSRKRFNNLFIKDNDDYVSGQFPGMDINVNLQVSKSRIKWQNHIYYSEKITSIGSAWVFYCNDRGFGILE